MKEKKINNLILISLLSLSCIFQFILFVFLLQTHASTSSNITKPINDTVPPKISIDTPLTSIAYSTRKIFVYGGVDGTGSQVTEVLINGQSAELIQRSKASSEIFNFFGEVEFESDGKFTISINAKDEAGNTSDTSLEIIIDTVFPRVRPVIEKSGNQFKVTGFADGTGSNILAIYVNDETIQPISQEKTEFTVSVSEVPIVISVVDFAGNQSILIIRDPFAADLTPPHIKVLTPSDGQSFKESPNISVALEVIDDFSVKEVSANGVILTKPENGIFSGNFILNLGVNLISVLAVDINGNEATEKIEVSYFPTVGEVSPTEGIEGLPGEKAYIVLPPPTRDLSDIILEEFLKILEQYLTDIASIGSIEIPNPPIILDGPKASIEAPKPEGFDILEEIQEGPLEIPKGFAFASNVDFSVDPGIVEISGEKDNQNVTLLVDSRGKTFAIGFAFFQEPQSNTSTTRTKKYRYQTTNGQPLDLVTTLSIPTDAAEGDAKVTIIRGNNSIATIPLKISSSKDVKVRNKVVAKPEISKNINAIVEKSGKQLKLKIKGKNFVGRTAIIDGKLEKLVSKANFFTNVAFVPDDGIKIKKFKLVNSETITLTAELSENITPGVKLFNVITPKGADIGAIIFPSPITDGHLETTAAPESLLVEDTNLE